MLPVSPVNDLGETRHDNAWGQTENTQPTADFALRVIKYHLFCLSSHRSKLQIILRIFAELLLLTDVTPCNPKEVLKHENTCSSQ